MKQLEEKPNDCAVVAVVRQSGERRASQVRQFVVRVGFLDEFIERIGWVNALEDGDFEVVVEIIFHGVRPDLEVLGNGLAVDCVKQRVECGSNG